MERAAVAANPRSACDRAGSALVQGRRRLRWRQVWFGFDRSRHKEERVSRWSVPSDIGRAVSLVFPEVEAVVHWKCKSGSGTSLDVLSRALPQGGDSGCISL